MASLKRAREEVIAEAKEPKEFVLIAGVASHDLDQRNSLEDALKKAGFTWVESSMSRALFRDGDYARFLHIAKAWARKRSGRRLTRVLRVEDPGIGICLGYPEDGPMARHGLEVTHAWARTDARTRKSPPANAQ